EALRIWRPFIALQPPLHLRQLERLASAAIEQPHLIAFRLAAAGRSERQIPAVGTEARIRLAVAAPRDLTLVLAVEADRPDVAAAGFVVLDVDLRDDEGHALPVGRALRVAHFLQPSEVVERERPFPGLRRRDDDRSQEQRQRKRQAFHTISQSRY